MKIGNILLIVAIVSAVAAQAQSRGAQKRPISEKDLFDFVWVANPELSPDGAHVAFTRVNCDDKRTGYETAIWMADVQGQEAPIRLTNGKHDGHPRWSPDGRQIAFIRAGEKDENGKPKPAQIAILSLSGGEARIITDLPKGASDPTWSPDGKKIAFVSETTPEDLDKEKKDKSADKPAGGEAKH